jgi:apolipoprotein N-acyltransferase
MFAAGLRPLTAVKLFAGFAIILIAACAHAASVAWPFDYYFPKGAPLWWLQCLALAALAWVLLRCTGWKQAAAAGGLFATVWLSSTFWWLFVAMHTYAGLHGVLAGFAVLALAAVLALYYAAACGIYWRLSLDKPFVASAVFAALWTFAEMARGTWLTGFGWGAAAYAHVDGPLAFYVPWLGAYGVGALAAWVAMALALSARSGNLQRAALVLVFVIPMALPSALREWSAPAGSLSVTLLQGNIPQDEKFEPGSGVPLALNWYAAQLQAARGDLVVAPETAIPLLPQQLPEGYWSALTRRFAQGGQAALVGIPLGSYSEGYTNSVLGLAANQSQPWRYDKHHLVPFGEFIPPLFKWFTQMMNIPLGDFNRGALGQPSFASHGQRLAPNICYEDLFGEELGARFKDPQSAPTIFVNVSNIGWFGDTVAIDQHLQISRMRALEFQRPFVRATNTGATVIMDHRAQVTASLPRHTRGVLEGVVEGRIGTTPYAWWVSRFGLWPLWLLGLAVLAWAVGRNQRAHPGAYAP